MNKIEFLSVLKKRLSGLPQADIDRTVDYYTEMIDDCMEEGMTSAQAVARMGTIDEIVVQARANARYSDAPKTVPPPRRRMRTWETVLLCVGFPLWFPLTLAAAIIALAVVIVIFAVYIVFYAVDLSLAAVAVTGILTSPIVAFGNGSLTQFLLFFGGGLVCAGLAVPLFFACNALTVKTASMIKHIIIRKRKEQR
ncbi:MAG: DUF1700 domain-containing protein [Clostridia bacterium]|nr:DUF1700 domain-containing protein [Clostridia bacterium]